MNSFRSAVAGLQVQVLSTMGDTISYDPLSSDPIELLAVVQRPQPEEGLPTRSRFLRLQIRESDLGNVTVEPGHRVVIDETFYRVLSQIHRDMHGWVRLVVEEIV